MTKKLLGIILIIVLAASLYGIALAADVVPAPPTMKLSVQISPLTIYPPYVIYTAQLSYMPPVITAVPKADFYNIYPTSPISAQHLGSAAFDKTGKAVLSIQMKSGSYTAVAKTVINGANIVSNQVPYKVP